jgi:hypothetical protein
MHHTTRLKRPGTGSIALIAFALTGAPFAARLDAQITEVGRTPVAETAQLTFGYRCDDRFVIRNDGARPVDLEYAVEKGTEHTKLTLGSRELVELDSKSKDPMELWMDGKLIAKAIKEKRSCKDVAGSASVLVAPLEVQTNERDQQQAYRGGAYPFYDPFFYGYYGYYGAFGYRPFYAGFVGVPIIIGGRGRGPGRRGR